MIICPIMSQTKQVECNKNCALYLPVGDDNPHCSIAAVGVTLYKPLPVKQVISKIPPLGRINAKG